MARRGSPLLRPGRAIRFSIADILAKHWHDYVALHRASIRSAVFENVRRVLQCRTPALGCHLYQCEQCGHQRVVPHSCKSRFCPTCGKHATDVWAERVLNDLLDVPYHHIVLSVPDQLHSICRWNRRVCFNILFEAAITSIQEWARKYAKPRMRCGIIAVLHTFGSDLKFHPHIHLIVTSGGLSLDGSEWVPSRSEFLMPHGGLKARWRYYVISLLRKAHKEGKLQFPGKHAYLHDYRCFNKIMHDIWEITWFVHLGAALTDPRFPVCYVGRYTKRAVLAEYRITYYNGEVVRFSYKDYAAGGQMAIATLPVMAFIQRLTEHIPDKGFPMVRHAGLFANRWRGRYLTQARAALAKAKPAAPAPTEETPHQPPLALRPWRDRQTHYSGTDPLACPRCQVPLRFVEVVMGPYYRVAMLFEAAGVTFRPQRE